MTLKEIDLMKWMKVIPLEPTKHRYSYACFECRKAFKEHLPFEGVACCPQCGGKVWGMEYEFKAPRKNDTAAWQRVYEWRTQARDPILMYRIQEQFGFRKRKRPIRR